jgi:hypothetical protein
LQGSCSASGNFLSQLLKRLILNLFFHIDFFFKNQQLFFAGEGTTYKYISSVHGAYITGRDAANKVIKRINNN